MYKLGDILLAVLPPLDDQEVVKILALVKKPGRAARVYVEDADGVRCWLDEAMICRRLPLSCWQRALSV